MLKISIILCKRWRNLGLGPLDYQLKEFPSFLPEQCLRHWQNYRYKIVDPRQTASIELELTITSPMKLALCRQGNLYTQIRSESLILKLDLLIQHGMSWYVDYKTICGRFRGSNE